MSYIVMECHPGYAVLLDEEGRFLKAANINYEVGQIVYNPILMKENQNPKKQWYTMRWISNGLVAVAACFLIVFGVNYYQNYLQPYSSIYLSINPMVQMNLNRKGTVVSLQGTNEDGKELLKGYNGKGKDKVTVVDELIDRAIDMGFLSEGGQVSFSIETPDEILFQEYGIELRTKVTEHMDGRFTIAIEIVNFKDEQISESQQTSQQTNEPINEQTNQQANEQTSQQTKEQTHEAIIISVKPVPSSALAETEQLTSSAPSPENPSKEENMDDKSDMSGSSDYGDTNYGNTNYEPTQEKNTSHNSATTGASHENPIVINEDSDEKDDDKIEEQSVDDDMEDDSPDTQNDDVDDDTNDSDDADDTNDTDDSNDEDDSNDTDDSDDLDDDTDNDSDEN